MKVSKASCNLIPTKFIRVYLIPIVVLNQFFIIAAIVAVVAADSYKAAYQAPEAYAAEYAAPAYKAQTYAAPAYEYVRFKSFLSYQQ